MPSTSVVIRNKYTTVTIPSKLFLRMERLVKANGDFKSVTDYVTFVLRELVISHMATGASSNSFNSKDLEILLNRFQALGLFPDDANQMSIAGSRRQGPRLLQ